jgi:ribosomal protein S18 acetylase RimI-like enzyme
LTAGLNEDTVFSMVLQDSNEIIGASILAKSEKTSEARMISLYLLPDKIGQGLGHIFYGAIEKELINRGFAKCVLDVLKNNERAISFYRLHGFTDINTESTAILDGQSYVCKVFEKVI